MRILVTNDDGINAPGLKVLQKIAGQLSDDVWTVAPETDQSGLSHSLTLSDPLRLRQLSEREFALRGTPTDCVIMGVRQVMDTPPDLLLSGVNAGQNIADDVTYSGTVAGAMEGVMLGVRSIALSQAYEWDGGRVVPWETVEAHGPDVIRRIIDADLPLDVLVNVNFPNCGPDEVAGMEITSQGKLTHGLFVEERTDGRGNPYFWLAYRRQPFSPRPGSDLTAIHEGKISLTPLRLDLTAPDMFDRLSSAVNRA
ncbi:5'/3'-nucleotidase SurE [Rhodobium gokarnense]|uniref:5'-nucleotidase SurE n=1 Tax=Rhodobium gokarnense TaxID=364296 RepID=A0ABT3HG10_9HYPH|nr:5'/3'-nucleotidase SurE [Rhodobium gokarnense]MCW2309211.1 5'-nucleotidase [Rhodobium gokarnense]